MKKIFLALLISVTATTSFASDNTATVSLNEKQSKNLYMALKRMNTVAYDLLGSKIDVSNVECSKMIAEMTHPVCTLQDNIYNKKRTSQGSTARKVAEAIGAGLGAHEVAEVAVSHIECLQANHGLEERAGKYLCTIETH